MNEKEKALYNCIVKQINTAKMLSKHCHDNKDEENEARYDYAVMYLEYALRDMNAVIVNDLLK